MFQHRCTGCWVGPAIGATAPARTGFHAAERAPEYGCRQCARPSVSAAAPALQEALLDPQVGLAQAPVKLLLRLYAPVKSEVSVSLSPVGLPKFKPRWPSKSNAVQVCLPGAGPRAGEPDVGLRTLTPVGETLQYNYSSVCGSPTREYGT